MDKLLTETLNKQKGFRKINRESKRLMLKKNECKPWLKKMWCIAEITPEYRERMYRLLDLYAEDYDVADPAICIDEKKQAADRRSQDADSDEARTTRKV